MKKNAFFYFAFFRYLISRSNFSGAKNLEKSFNAKYLNFLQFKNSFFCNYCGQNRFFPFVFQGN